MDNLEFADQKIVNIEMEKEVKKSFIEYSMSVIMSRALPDVRDGLKPVHRRILYAMYEDNLTYDKPYHKSAATVGNVLGRYHPHGDSAVYDTMVRLAQSFSMRYPLVDGYGNFGNIDGDQAAAYRYTEARMSRLSNEMLRDIEKEVVDFVPNFDNKRSEPSVLPSRFPNLLVNGSMGIAVGMATNVPPHNLGEVIDATICMIDNPDATVAELMQHIHGPDFPTGASICGTAGILEAYTTGRGRITVRATADLDEEKRRIVITEIPYQVNKSSLVQAMADCVKDKRIEGITEIRDESGRAGMRIVVEYRRDAIGPLILNQLYKYTQLKDTCAVNMLALVGREPKLLTLRDALSYYIAHQEEIVVRRATFELNKAKNEAHVSEGFKFAIDNIDEVVRVIRASASVSEAKKNLINAFSAAEVENFLARAGADVTEERTTGLSDAQAQAIVEMPLGRLAGLERNRIEERLTRLYESIRGFEETLADEQKRSGIIKEELLEIKRRFGDERRTIIEPVEDEILPEDLIERHSCLITMTDAGYIKRLPSDSYAAQRRGGKGLIGMSTKEEDSVNMVISADSHSDLLLFTNTGKVHTLRAYQVPESSRTSKGSNIVNLLELTDGERVTAMITAAGYDEGFLTMVTRLGKIKRTDMKAYEYQRKGGKIAINLAQGDELIRAFVTSGEDDIIIATAGGNLIRFDENNAGERGRTAGTVWGIRTKDGDEVIGALAVSGGESLLTVTEGGFGKRSAFDSYNPQNRGGYGVRCHAISKRTGRLAGIAAVSEGDDILLITDGGTVIRTPADDIPVYGRAAAGVIVMRLTDGSKIVNLAKISGCEVDYYASEEPDCTDEDLADEDADVDLTDIDIDLTDEDLAEDDEI